MTSIDYELQRIHLEHQEAVWTTIAETNRPVMLTSGPGYRVTAFLADPLAPYAMPGRLHGTGGGWAATRKPR